MTLPKVNPISSGSFSADTYIKHTGSTERACGLCGILMHDTYEFLYQEEIHNLMDKKGKENNKSRKRHKSSGINCACAMCPQCSSIWPLDTNANEALYKMGVITSGEYLSYAGKR